MIESQNGRKQHSVLTTNVAGKTTVRNRLASSHAPVVFALPCSYVWSCNHTFVLVFVFVRVCVIL